VVAVRDDAAVPHRLVVLAAGLVVGLSALLIARADPVFSFAGDGWGGAVALAAAGWGLMVAGLSAASRRPWSLISPLLVGAGAAWFVAEWDNQGVGSAWVFTAGLVLANAAAPLVAWTVLSYPTGRLESVAGRAGAAAGVVIGVLVLGVVPALVFDPVDGGCPSCARNLLAVTDDLDRFVDLNRVGLRLGSVWAVAVVVLMAWRIARSSPARRRLVAPVAVAGCGYLAAVAASYAAGIERGFVGSGDVDRRLWFAQAVCLTGLAAAVVWNVLRGRRTRSVLAKLVVELGESAAAGGLAAVLARTLGDAGLEVAYPISDSRCVDADGRSIDVTPENGCVTTPLVRGSETVAILVHRRGLLDHSELVEEVASAARLALDNERLQAEIRVQEADLRASRARIVEAGDAERRRLERDLHDGAQQRLVAMLAGVRLLQLRHGAGANRAVDAQLDEIVAALEGATRELRDIAHGIHPSVLSDEGLVAAFESLAENGDALVLAIEELPDERLPQPVEHAAYRVVAEAARTGACLVVAARHGDALRIDVAADRLPASLRDLEDRVGAIDGSIRVDERPDGGVTLRVELPCA
jgi:signal transduction histidine kinase